jgi:hypothetical protein
MVHWSVSYSVTTHASCNASVVTLYPAEIACSTHVAMHAVIMRHLRFSLLGGRTVRVHAPGGWIQAEDFTDAHKLSVRN